MPYAIKFADGTVVREIPDNIDPAVAKANILKARPELAGPAPKKSTIAGEAAKGLSTYLGQTSTGLESLFSPEAAARAGTRAVGREEESEQKHGVGPSMQAVKDVFEQKGLFPAVGEALGQFPRAIAGSAPQMAAVATGARLGAMAGAPFTPFIGPAGPIIGGIAGAGLAALPATFGSHVERQAQEQIAQGQPVDINRAKAFATAVPSVAVDIAGEYLLFGKKAIKGLLGVADDAALATAKADAKLAAKAEQSRWASTPAGAAKGLVAELPAELTQAVLERYQAGLSLTDADALAEYGETLYQAGLVGGGIGGARGFTSPGRAKGQIAARKARAQQEAEAKAREEEAAKQAVVDQIHAQAKQTPEFQAFEQSKAEAEQLPKGPVRKAVEEDIKAQQAAFLDQAVAQAQGAPVAEPAAEATAVEPAAEIPVDPNAVPFTLRDVATLVKEASVKDRYTQKWLLENVVGKSRDDLKQMVAANPKLAEGKGKRAELVNVLITPAPAAYAEEATNAPQAKAAAPAVASELGNAPAGGGARPDVISSGEGTAAPVAVAEPGADGVPAAAEGLAGADQSGMADVEPDLAGTSLGAAAPDVALTGETLPLFTGEQAPTPEQAAATPEAVAPATTPKEAAPKQGALFTPTGRPTKAAAVAPAVKVAPVAEAAPAVVSEPVIKKAKPTKAEIVARQAKQRDAAAKRAAEAAPVVKPVEKPKKVKKAAKPTAEDLEKQRQEELAKNPAKRLTTLAGAGDISAKSKDYSNIRLLIAKGDHAAANAEMDRIVAARADKLKAKAEAAETGTKAHQGAIENEVDLHPDVLAELESGNAASAFNELATVGSSEFVKTLAARLRLLLPNTTSSVVENLKGPKGQPVLGLAWNDGSRIAVDKANGTTEETLLHEGVHAATEHVITMPVSERTEQQNKAIEELTDLWEEAKRLDMPMSEYAREALSEFVAEAMSKTALQVKLQAVQWKSKSMWEGFKRIILQALGVAKPTTMLEATIASVDSIFKVPPGNGSSYVRAQVSASTQAIVDRLAPVQKAPATAMLHGVLPFKGGWGVNGLMEVSGAITKLRTLVSDRQATLSERVAKEFNNGVRSATGKINPELLMRQAYDADKLLLDFFLKGALKFVQNLGIYQVTTQPGVRPPAEVFTLIDKWGEKHGYDPKKASEIAGRILEGARLHEMRAEYKKNGDKLRSHLTDAEIDTLYAEYKADPMLEDMSKLMNESREAMIDHMVQVGRLTKKEGKEWKAVVAYVPFNRVEDVGEFATKFREARRTGRALTSFGKLPEFVGSETRPVKNVFENYINLMSWTVQQTLRTHAVNRMLWHLKDSNPSQAKYLGPDKHRATNPESVVDTYVKGKLVHFELPSAYDAMAFNDATKPLPPIFKLMGNVSNVLRTAITAFPLFSAKQIVVDAQRMMLQSGISNPVAGAGLAFKYFGQLSKAGILDVRHPMMEKAGVFGLAGGVDWSEQGAAGMLLKNLGREDRKLLGSTKLGSILHKMESISHASDLAIRMAIYDQTMAETHDEALALTRAREIINFRRRGAGDRLGLLNIMIQTIPFFNAYIQGMDVLLRSLTGKNPPSGLERQRAMNLFYSRAAMMGGISLMYALAAGDDDEYDSTELEKRDGMFMLGHGVSIPVPSELGILFKAPIERMVEYSRKQGTPREMEASEAIGAYMSALLHQAYGNVVPIPQAVRPAFEAITNVSFRTMRPIEGIYQRGLLPSERALDTTSDFAKNVAKFAKDSIGVEVSPIMIDHVFNGYLGTSAALVTTTADAVLNPDKMDRPLHKFVGASAFTYNPVGTRYISEFYDLRESVVQAHNTMLRLAKDDPERMEQFQKDHAEDLALYSVVNGTLQQLQQTRAAKHWLTTPAAEKEMSPEERAEQKKVLDKRDQEIVEAALMQRREIRKLNL